MASRIPLLSAREAPDDFDVLRRALEEAHDGLTRYRTKAELDRRFNAARAQVSGLLTQLEFARLLPETIAGNRDILTGMRTRLARAFATLSWLFGEQSNMYTITASDEREQQRATVWVLLRMTRSGLDSERRRPASSVSTNLR